MKAVKVLAVVIVLSAVSFFFLKDILLKSFIEHYAVSKLGVECGVKDAGLSFKKIALKGVSVSHESFSLTMGKVEVYLSYGKGIIPEVYRVDLDGVKADVSDFDRAKEFVLSKAGGERNKPGAKSGREEMPFLDVNINKADIKVVSPKMFDVQARVSFKGRVYPRRMSDLYSVDISQGKIKVKGFSSQFSLSPKGHSRYMFRMSGMKMKDKKIPDLSFYLYPVRKIPCGLPQGRYSSSAGAGFNTLSEFSNGIHPESKSVSFQGVETSLLGADSSVKGVMDISGRGEVCVDADFDKSSFERIVDLFAGKESLSFRGIFKGGLKFCLAGGVSCLSGKFINKEGGLINIKKEASLSFLKKYLDPASYQALISNLKNYSYNKGQVNISQEEKAVRVNMDFYSSDLGKRNLAVTLHGF